MLFVAITMNGYCQNWVRGLHVQVPMATRGRSFDDATIDIMIFYSGTYCFAVCTGVETELSRSESPILT